MTSPAASCASFESALMALDRVRARALLEEALANTTPVTGLEGIVVPALERIGSAWAAGKLSLAEVYMSGRLCAQLVDALLPRSGALRPSQPRMAIALLNDYHELGKRMVCSTLRAAGFEIRDYGRLTPPQLIERASEDDLEVLLVSVLMLPSALDVRRVVDGLAAAGARTQVVVGGAPFRLDPSLWREVGAVAMGAAASDAVAIVKRFSTTEVRP